KQRRSDRSYSSTHLQPSLQASLTTPPGAVREPHLYREAKAAGGAGRRPSANRGLAGVGRPVPDARAVHVDVVEDRGAELVGTAGGILPLVEDDLDPLDRARDRDERKVGWTGDGGRRGDAEGNKRRQATRTPPVEPYP